MSHGVTFLKQRWNFETTITTHIGVALSSSPKPLHALYLILIKLANRADARINSILQVRKLGFRSVKQSL